MAVKTLRFSHLIPSDRRAYFGVDWSSPSLSDADMGFKVIVFKESGFVYTKYSGYLESREMEQALFATLESPDYSPGMVELTDLSDLEGSEIQLETLELHSSRMSAYYAMQAAKTVHFVFAPSEYGYGLAQAYSRLAKNEIENLDLIVFRSEAETLAAMGRQESSIAELLENGTLGR